MAWALASGARGTTLYVSPAGTHQYPFANWTEASTSIPIAVQSAPNNATVLLAKAEFVLEQEIRITNSLVLRGNNGAKNTVVDGGQTFRCVSVTCNEAVLDGLTFMHGKASIGGGIYCNGTNILINNCIVTGNEAEYGGGAFIDDGRVTIVNCTVSSNLAHRVQAKSEWPQSSGGGLFIKDNNCRVLRCTIRENQATPAGEGGGLMLYHPVYYSSGNFSTDPIAAAEIADCLIESNRTDFTGGGVACFGWNYDLPFCTQYDLFFTNCTIRGNTSQHGAGFYHCYWGTIPHLSNCRVEENEGTGNGAGVRLFNTYYIDQYGVCQSTSVFVNCNIAFNRATNNQAVYVSDSLCYFLNSVIWSNEVLGSMRLDTSGQGTQQEAEYCCIEGGYPGIGLHREGNTNANPLLNDRVHLFPGSPCIDKGTNLAWMAGTRDCDGQPRVFNGRVDIGVDEAVVEAQGVNPTNAWRLSWEVVPQGVYQLQSAGSISQATWNDEGGAFTANEWNISLEITNRSEDIQCHRLLWKQP
ncbi:MAG TPA: hypothetical protein DCZ95_06810 [Verrucomicrobia bacterium]|nr:MAG: hypothetical protein A2X46_00840 [Lentisphaerae bacterium GWF2_57_35]HBA83786.1 hypothetical protein [Verrucomicrobiota bacterium]